MTRHSIHRNTDINFYFLFLVAVFSIFTASCLSVSALNKSLTDQYRVTAVYPHDKNAQTQGLLLHDGFLYEGTGPCLDGPSSLRKIDLETGEILKYSELPEPLFGEGITIFGDRIIQLTYRANTGFVYDLESFERLGEFYYDTEGWGLTNDGEYLIMSDGSAVLHYLDPVTFERGKQLRVRDNHGELNRINALAYIDGEIYANIFLTPYIVRISPETGRVIERIDLSIILKDHFVWSYYAKPANGIAWDPDTGSMYVTGKYWPKLFRLQITD